MASSAEHTIDIIFSGIDDVTERIRGINSNIDSLGKSAKGLSEISAPFKDLTEKLLILEAAFGGIGIAIIKSRGDIVSATKDIEATLDITSEKAKELEPIFKSLYSEGFADSIEEAASAVKISFQKLGDIGNENLDSVAAKALTLKKAFGIELNDSIGAAKNLMKDFGLSSSHAFDFITSGFQQGLNGSGDFLESINEYSVQFADGGAKADQFFSLMKTGFKDGIFGTDKAADAFAEFNKTILDGSKAREESLKMLGINSDEFFKKLSDGSMSGIEAFNQIIKKIGETEDKSVQMQAGVGLLGTQFEDFAKSGVLALDTTAVKMDELTGKTGELQNKLEDTAPFEKFWRTLTSEIGDIPIFDKFYDEAVDAVRQIREILPEAFDKIDYSELESSLQNLREIIKGIFGGADLTTVDGLQKVIQKVVDTFASFQNTVNGVIESFGPFISIIGTLIESYNDLDEETQEGIGNIIGYGAQFSEITGMISSVTEAYGGVAEAASSGSGKFFAWAAAAYAAFEAGYKLGEYLRSLSPEVDKTAEGFFKWADSILDFTGTAGKASDGIDDFTKKMIDEAKAMQEARKATENTKESVKNLSKTVKDAKNDIKDNPVKIGISLDEFQKELKKGVTEYYVTTKEELEKNGVEFPIKFDANKDAVKANEYIKGIGEQIKGLELKLETDRAKSDIVSISKALSEVENEINNLNNEKAELNIALKENLSTGEGYGIAVRLNEIKEDLERLNTEKADIAIAINETDFVKTQREIDKLVTEKHLTVLADESSVAHAKGFIAEKLGDHTVVTNIFPPSKENAKKTKEELEKIVPPEKQLKIMADLELGKFQEETKKFDIAQETIQKKMQFKAELDIKEAEVNAQILGKTLDNLGTMFSAAGSVISDAFGALAGLDFGSAMSIDIFRLIRDQIKEQNELQQKGLELNERVLEAQIALNKAKQQALLLGKPMIEISVDGSGLQYQLESILYEIMRFAQVKAAEEGIESLLGIN